MTIVVEDGTIVDGANSYVDTSDLIAFAAARGVTLVTDEEVLLIKAMDFIESLQYKGTKSTAEQPLQWPRNGVSVDGYPIDNNVVPVDLQNGLMQCAIAIDQGNDPLQDSAPGVKRKKVDVIEIEYQPGASSATFNQKILKSLWKLLAGGYGKNIVNVGKA